MVKFSRIIVTIAICVVLQVCIGNPIASDDVKNVDVTKLFTADELQRARSVGILDHQLVNGRNIDLSVDEMIQLLRLAENEKPVDTNGTSRPTITFNEMAKVCEIFIPGLKLATNYTKVQETHLNELMVSLDHIPIDMQYSYIKSVCPYLSDPFLLETDANSFGLELIPYMKFRFWKSKNQNATGVERVVVVKELCCIYKGRGNIKELKVKASESNLSGEKMAEFENHWNEFETANTSKSFEEVCDFLRATNPSKEC